MQTGVHGRLLLLGDQPIGHQPQYLAGRYHLVVTRQGRSCVAKFTTPIIETIYRGTTDANLGHVSFSEHRHFFLYKDYLPIN